ncbi:MAG: hypothetical protein ACKVN9_05040 [Methylophilaceae bacterium]
MDNKYALGSSKVAHEHHDAKLKETSPVLHCRFCGGEHLIYSPTMEDHHCQDCGQNQEDLPQGYSTGRSADY